ncbi:MAG TPA: phosphatase PAP2 family protein [Candidatus Nitrosotalea sp.]|nr:phosphatase PAP2 family protein [Candidatus Nitrosotalea sp.]
MKYYFAGIVLLALFAVLAFVVTHDRDQVTSWDYSVFSKINTPQHNALDKIMVGLTKYGREAIWIATTALVFIFGKASGRRTAVLLVISFIILIPLGSVLKDEIDRPRPVPADPGNVLVNADSDPSFPSGHAVIVSAGAFVMLARFNQKKQAIASIILAAEAALVIYSRIYVGNHYPLDVLGGTLLGTGIASLVVGASGRLNPLFQKLDSIRK